MIEINKTDLQKSIKEKLKALKKQKSTSTSHESTVSIQQSPFFDQLLQITQTENIKLDLKKL